MSEQVLPFYVVCDESSSMTDDLHVINSALPELHVAIGSDPVVADKTRFCLIGFADKAQVLLPLSDLSDVDAMPGLTPQGMTDYGAAFRLLRDEIERDVEMLKADGHKVFRPAVFFLSDGQPTDGDWERAYDALVDRGFAYHPNIISFGIGDADATIIQRVATVRAFMIDRSDPDPALPGRALREFAKALTSSITKSGRAVGGQGMTLAVPDQIDGFTALQADAL